MALNEEGIRHLELAIELSSYSFTRGGNAQEEAATLERLRQHIEPKLREQFNKFVEAFEYEDQEVEVVYDNSRPLTFDMQRTEATNSGALSVGALLDKVVFDVPITSYDM